MKWFLKCFKQYVDFKGRARRREFWFFALFCSIISLVLMIALAVPTVKQVSDLTVMHDEESMTSKVHTENINEDNAQELLDMLQESGIIDLPAEVTDNEDAKIAKAQVVTINANNLNDETVKDLLDILEKNSILDEDLADQIHGSMEEAEGDEGASKIDYDKRLEKQIAATMMKNPIYWIYLVFCLVILLPSIAVAVRRLHDIGRSGWWYLFFVVITSLPQLAIILNRSKVAVIILSCIALVALVCYIIWLCKDSQAGENKWGPNPKELNVNDQPEA